MRNAVPFRHELYSSGMFLGVLSELSETDTFGTDPDYPVLERCPA